MDFLNTIPSFFSFEKPALTPAEKRSIEKDYAEIRNRISKLGRYDLSIEQQTIQDMNKAWNETIQQLSTSQDLVINAERQKTDNRSA